jgi:RNA polymerase sigma-70 factor (ECF subfamily)
MDNLEQLSDEGLVACLKRDERAAFRAIYERYASQLFRYLGNRMDTREACEQILIDVFVLLWSNRHSINEGQLKEYLFSTLRYKIFKYIRDNPTNPLYAEIVNHFQKYQYGNDKEEKGK